jgi:hypothetical protein
MANVGLQREGKNHNHGQERGQIKLFTSATPARARTGAFA